MAISKKTLDEVDGLDKEDVRKIEAVLFIAGRFLNMGELISLSDLNPLLIREILESLEKKYSEGDFAMQIVKKGVPGKELWKMDIRPEYSDIVNRLATGNSEFSKAEQETLAIIAYKQPIKQSVVIKIRGNKAYDHISRFHDLGLINKKKQGHTYDLSLSEDFYNYFNVNEKSDKEE